MSESLAAFSTLVDQCTDSSAVRLGDVLGVLVTHHARHEQWKQVCHPPVYTVTAAVVLCL